MAKRQKHAGLHARFRRISDLTPRSVLRQPFTLPAVIGDDFTVEEEALWEEFQTVSAGTFATPAAGEHGVALQTISTEALTLTWDPSWLAAPGQNPRTVINTLRKILRKRAVFDLLVTRKPGADFAEFADFASIRRLAVTVKRGEPDTRYFQIDFAQHRRISSRRRRHGRTANLPTTATLDANDTLRSLALHYYGSESRWRLIAEANGIKQWGGADPLVKMGRFKVGDRIKIPDRPPSSGGTEALPPSSPAIGVAMELT
jgi:nucleoid-associated protein YgaU